MLLVVKMDVRLHHFDENVFRAKPYGHETEPKELD